MTIEHPPVLSVSKLVDQFLSAMKPHSAPGTYKFYAIYLRSFVADVSPMRVDDLTSSIVHDWINKRYGKLSDSTRHSAARAVVRTINWAVDERLIERSPLKGFRKPAPGRREMYVAPDQYAKLLQNRTINEKVDGVWTQVSRPLIPPALRDVVKFLWHSGCRPQELRIVEGRWIDGQKIVLPKELSKGKRNRRVIYLDDMALRIVVRLAKQYPKGPVFRNAHGGPWTKSSLGLNFERLRNRTGIDGLCAYSFRHGFITRMLEKGTDIATVAALAGNSPQMIMENYNHVAANESRLLAQLD